MTDTMMTADQAYARAQALWKRCQERRDLRDRMGWEPPDPNHPTIAALVHHGYLRRTDGRCGVERFKDSHVVWTDAARRLFAPSNSQAA